MPFNPGDKVQIVGNSHNEIEKVGTIVERCMSYRKDITMWRVQTTCTRKECSNPTHIFPYRETDLILLAPEGNASEEL